MHLFRAATAQLSAANMDMPCSLWRRRPRQALLVVAQDVCTPMGQACARARSPPRRFSVLIAVLCVITAPAPAAAGSAFGNVNAATLTFGVLAFVTLTLLCCVLAMRKYCVPPTAARVVRTKSVSVAVRESAQQHWAQRHPPVREPPVVDWDTPPPLRMLCIEARPLRALRSGRSLIKRVRKKDFQVRRVRGQPRPRGEPNVAAAGLTFCLCALG